MKHIQIIMPEVKHCTAKSCGFIRDSGCHARAITVGYPEAPGCDTFFAIADTSEHAKSTGRTSGVGACKVSDCRFNEDYECMADEVTLAYSKNQAHCQTYLHR